MQIRRLVSLLALLSFVILIITSIVLYIVPYGRVAYWTDWRLLGLTKTEWQNLHINIGIQFLLAICLHIYYNWKAIVKYLKGKMEHLVIFTTEFNLALIITLAVGIGTYLMLPPFSTIIELNESIKDAAGQRYGNPPYGHAELSSLKVLCQRTGIDLKQAMQNLQHAQIQFKSPADTVLNIARANNLTPQQVFVLIKGKAASTWRGLPSLPPSGLGRRSLADLCQEFGLNVQQAVTVLKQAGYQVEPDATLKQIAASKGERPFSVYQILQQNFK